MKFGVYTISDLHPIMKRIQEDHHIYGLECILSEVARVYKNEDYVDHDYLLDLFDECINRIAKEDQNEN